MLQNARVDAGDNIWEPNKLRLFVSHTSAHKHEVGAQKLGLAKLGVNAFVAHEDIGEVALQEVACPLGGGLVRDRRPLLRAAQLADEPVLAHHARDLVAADVDVAALELLPGLAGAVDAPAS